MQKRWLTLLGAMGMLLAALLLTACGGSVSENKSAPPSGVETQADVADRTDEAVPVVAEIDEANEASLTLIGVTPGRPALVEFYAKW